MNEENYILMKNINLSYNDINTLTEYERKIMLDLIFKSN